MVMVRNSLPVSDIKIYSYDNHPYPPYHTSTHVHIYSILILSTFFIQLTAPAASPNTASLHPSFLCPLLIDTEHHQALSKQLGGGEVVKVVMCVHLGGQKEN